MGYVYGIELEELPYWETINLYLEKVADQELQEMICKLVKQLLCSRKELDGGCLYRIHRRGTEEEYREYYYYVLG